MVLKWCNYQFVGGVSLISSNFEMDPDPDPDPDPDTRTGPSLDRRWSCGLGPREVCTSRPQVP